MPARQTECAFGSCKFACIRSSHRRNFLAAYPDGYPSRGSNVYTCRECKHGCSQTEMQVDHMKPKSEGGTNCVKNLQPLCGVNTPSKCNQKKGKTYGLGDKLANKASPAVRRRTAQVFDMFSCLTL